MATAIPLFIEEPGQDLAQKTVCIKVQLGLLGNTRKVSNSQVEVDADKDLIRVSKRLLTSPELQAIRCLDGEIRRYPYNTCLPFEAGVHLLPLPLIETVDQRLREYEKTRSDRVEQFLDAYPRLCQEATVRLRALYNPRDYSPEDQVRASFTFTWRYVSFGVPGQLREISARIFETERDKAAQMMAEASDEIQQVLCAALAELVARLRDRLVERPDGKPQRLRASTVERLREFLGSFDFRNVTGDQELKQLVEKARSLMSGVTTDAIRNTSELRTRLREGMEDIAASLEPLVMQPTRRKFRLEEE